MAGIEHITTYLKRIGLLLLLVPIHEFIHAGLCVGLGGDVAALNPASHMVCGGNVGSMFLYNSLNELNQVATSGIAALHLGRTHLELFASVIELNSLQLLE